MGWKKKLTTNLRCKCTPFGGVKGGDIFPQNTVFREGDGQVTPPPVCRKSPVF